MFSLQYVLKAVTGSTVMLIASEETRVQGPLCDLVGHLDGGRPSALPVFPHSKVTTPVLYCDEPVVSSLLLLLFLFIPLLLLSFPLPLAIEIGKRKIM